MNVAKQIREAYPNALNGLFFKSMTEDEIYQRFLRIMGMRVPSDPRPLAGLANILHHADMQREGRPTGFEWTHIKRLTQGYNEVGFRQLLAYLVMATGYGRDDVGTREFFLKHDLTETVSTAAGRLTELLANYLGNDFVLAGSSMQLFARALVVLAGGSYKMTYAEALHGLTTNVSEAVRPQIYHWINGIAPDWVAILKLTEVQYGQQKVHEIFAEVGLRKPVNAKISPFRAAVVARLTEDQRRLLVYDDIELGRRLLNNMCKYWGVERPKNFIHDQKFLETYLKECNLSARVPYMIGDLLQHFCRCKPSERNWNHFFDLLNNHCSAKLWNLLQENLQERSEDQYTMQERLMEQVEREQRENLAAQMKKQFADIKFTPVMYPPDMQVQYYTDAIRAARVPYTTKDKAIAKEFPANFDGRHDIHPSLVIGQRIHEALEKEKTTMPTITDKKNSAIQTTFETVKEATKHGVAVATADGLANTALRTGMKLVPQLENVDLTPEAASFVKYGVAVAAIGLAESGAIPGVNAEAVTAGAALVIEAAARDGFQPLVEAFSPLIEQLATAGAKALQNAGKAK